ncbi:PTS system mannose/fructose/sorbose family transporter subunit IID [[Clostridium] innocuum]|uniref:PTS system mannose/fructose/sorbose family transporter subunit IID n=1 Tax=Clostridium innocuum TaxID=1522 RepID=UPI0021089565|nr:PTS system mannose/fructose/sorbose family transporter subunit IID [[Clostridium] innocuum]MCQ4709134.1 PTS system mannose/fructose/sorbose family transporter subunit IID [[Clostridium] innocuum]
MSKEKVLTKKDLRKAAWRWLIGISTFNYETQLAPSTLFSYIRAYGRCIRMMRI